MPRVRLWFPTLLAGAIVAATACAEASRDAGDGTAGDSTSADTVAAISFEGVGRLRAGMRVSEALTLLGGTVDTGSGPMEGSNCNHVRFSSLPSGVLVMTFADTLVRFQVNTTDVFTRAGAAVGATEADIRRMYGASGVRQEPHPYTGPEGHYLVVDLPSDTLHRIIFETDGAKVQSYRSGFRRAVDLIEGCS